MSYHVTGYCAGHVEDKEALKALWTIFVQGLEQLVKPEGEQFHGFIAGGDWVGDTQARQDEFRLTADEVRDKEHWGER